MSTRIYQRLDTSQDEIRLLRPCQAGNKNAWELVTHSIQTCPPFAALSYLWGIDAQTNNITVNDQSFPITSSLACALDHVEQHWRSQFPTHQPHTFHLWADAVCINEDDVAERGQQVKLMGRIYETAHIVMASLGPLDEAIETSIDTLPLVYNHVKDIPDDASMEVNIAWMKAYPSLISADVGLPDDQFDANKAWKMLRQLLYMDYWRRAWVVQELVLAQKLIFFSESKALNPDALFKTLEWFNITKRIARNETVVRPDWLIASVWNFLTYENLLGWKAVHRIYSARKDDRNSRRYRLTLGHSGGDLRATDPRDLVYGTMALTKMGIEPDYSENLSLGKLYAASMAWWMQLVTEAQVEEQDWTYNHLDLLGGAGVGQITDESELQDLLKGVPSWVQNFGLQGKLYVPHILSFPRSADARIFPEDALLPRVEELSLHVPGIVLDKVVKVDKVKDIKAKKGLLEFVISCCVRHPQHPSGIPTLQAVFRTLLKDILGAEDPEDEEVITRFFGFLRAMIHGPETGTINLTPEAALAKLGFSTASESAFVESFNRLYASELSTEDLGQQGQWLGMLLQPAWDGKWSDPAIHDLCLRTVLEIRELDYTCIVETASGYLAVAPIGSKQGDEICLLHKSDSASLIRAAGGHWQYVGQCYSFGLSECRTESLSKSMGDYTLLELR